MKHGFGTSVGLVACLALATGARAAVNEPAGGNPYHAIVDRNVFDLHAPVVVPPKTTEIPKPPANVKLTGLTTIFGVKKAYFSILEPPPPGKPAAKLKYYSMVEQQIQDGLEVVEIDIKGQKVKIRKDGEPSELTLEKPKASGGPPGGGMPLPGGRVNPVPMPAYAPAAAAVVPNYQYPGGVNNNPNNAAAAAAAAPLSQIPRPLRGDQQMDPETQIILMEAERLRTQESVAKGDMPPIPFTPITDEVMGTTPPGPGLSPGSPGGVQSPVQPLPDNRIFSRPR